MRTVILHYHLFKNAGTSLDESFKDNFKGDEWVTKEFPLNQALNRQQLKQWIIDNPQAKCFSSHTAIFPVPKIEGVNIIPVIFMRHPIDRIISAYSFEKKQGGNGFGSVLARNTDLAGYIEIRLSLSHDRQCRNFHIERFMTMFTPDAGSELERSKRAIDELAFVGDVGDYAASLKRLEDLLNATDLKGTSLEVVEKNVSRVSKSIEDKMSDFKRNVGDSIFEKVIAINEDDLTLYSYLKTERNYA
ncbi:sulfotransferase family 2 domain-containing protein [Pelagibaculum spongiae]|uniref:Sulfotransferase family protein n=1 Tax=Pelagibaculum spongiae TaxID=2080658 RepID=A0A2V1GX63_9GAMM|nr:sulfotransferase family 2 domain-containing protein [Pelagibaculum spongiae]PVZ70243.1 hypothetical protein DC094_06485 [Pelagibaculum spongiae]